MRSRIKGAVKVASSSNILAARYTYIKLMKEQKKKVHKLYIKVFGRKIYITKEEAFNINFEGVCIE